MLEEEKEQVKIKKKRKFDGHALKKKRCVGLNRKETNTQVQRAT